MRRRPHLAQAMLDGYDGWHMVNPLVVRRHELIVAFGGQALTAEDVFTTTAESPFHTYRPTLGGAVASSAQEQIADIIWRAAWEELLREETLPKEDLDATNAVIERWAATHAALAQYLRDNPAERDIRMVAATFMIGDLKLEIAQACARADVSGEELAAHLQPENVVGFFTRLPFTGRVLQVTQTRLRNPSDKWVNHDLNDLYFLACSAAYADHVVAEKKTGHLLNVAGRTLPAQRASVHLNLRSLVRDTQVSGSSQGR
ncbi:hypothetical protein [Streptomyces peucetius]|nr:hypothetical protein CGZ69_00485 [Streptomyces peucetius subsp. caesius ATCC 27952]